MPNDKTNMDAADFLLAEFNALQQRAIQIEQSKSSGINFYLLIVAATIAGVPGLLGLVASDIIPVVLIAAFLFIFIVGLLTLDHSVNQTIMILMLYRRAGRIRRYFVERNDDIEVYLPFDSGDDRPSINIPGLAYRGAEAAAFTINIASVSIVSVTILSSISWVWTTIAALFVAPIAWILQRIYIRRKLQRFEEDAQRSIRFPRRSHKVTENTDTSSNSKSHPSRPTPSGSSTRSG